MAKAKSIPVEPKPIEPEVVQPIIDVPAEEPKGNLEEIVIFEPPTIPDESNESVVNEFEPQPEVDEEAPLKFIDHSRAVDELDVNGYTTVGLSQKLPLGAKFGKKEAVFTVVHSGEQRVSDSGKTYWDHLVQLESNEEDKTVKSSLYRGAFEII